MRVFSDNHTDMAEAGGNSSSGSGNESDNDHSICRLFSSSKFFKTIYIFNLVKKKKGWKPRLIIVLFDFLLAIV